MEFYVLNFLSTMETNLLWQFHVLNFLSTMEGIFYGVSRVKLSFYNGNNLQWGFPC